VLLTVPASAAFGTLVGVLAGSRLGFVDKLLMRIVDVQLAMPAILFAILLAAVFGPSLRNVIIIIVVWTWSGYARLVRGETLSLRERDFVVAARSIGANDVWIVTRHIVPNVLNAVVILATLEVAQVILIEAALSFLGVGVGLGTPSWGAMVSEGRSFLTIAWWIVGIPGIAILLVSLSGNLAGDWLRDALDPRLRNLR
jgi:peptide/nickel transport system permease protein